MDDFIRELGEDHSQTEVIQEFKKRFGVDLTLYQYKNRKHKLGVVSKGNAGWFKPGHGGFFSEEHKRAFVEGGKNTRFKKGNIPYNAKDKPVGFERLTKDGYIEVKIADHPSHKDCNDNWRAKHLLIWEREHGKRIPPKHAVLFADGDKRNLDPENLVLVSRRQLMMINRLRIPYYDRESLEAAMAVADLHLAVSDVRKRPKKCKVCGSEFVPEYPHQARCRPCIDANRR